MKPYPVKSNAARAAKKYGLGRGDLIAVEGGWTFNLPPGNYTAEVDKIGDQGNVVSVTNVQPTNEQPASGVPITDPSHPDYDARALHTLEPTKQGNGGNTTTTTKESDVKTKTKKTKTAKSAKAKAAKPANGKPGRKRAENGIGAKVIAELKARWTPLATLIEMTGWEPHTTRAYISVQSRKLELKVERRRHEGETQYRIVAA